ncbi:MAG: hypothetical protein WC030_00785 [Candidatus Paceibacterota bacterium]
MNSRIAPLFALFIAGTMLFAYVSPTWSGSIAETKVAIQSADDALASARDYVKKQDVLAQQTSAIDPGSLKRLSAFLPDSVDNVSLILSLSALAARTGLVLSSIDVSGNTSAASSGAVAENANLVNSIDLALTASGPYGAFQNFLRGIEKSQRLLDVRTISVTGTNTNRYVYQMTLRIYWLR